jgi:hypothetical protein
MKPRQKGRIGREKKKMHIKNEKFLCHVHKPHKIISKLPPGDPESGQIANIDRHVLEG